MSVSPILPGRLPNTLLARQLQQRIQASQSDLVRLQEMASTNQRFFRPSEDPANATKTIFFQKEVERNSQLLTNVSTDRQLLSATETNFQSVADALVKARAIAAAGIGDSTTTEEKQALASEVRSLIQQVLQNANGTFRGRSLFGGTYTTTPPFEHLANGRVVYYGDAGSIESQLGSSFLLANNVDGATAFGALTQAFSADLNPALTLETRLSDLQGGAGTPLGAVRVTVDDGVNPAVVADVDLTGAETIGDIKTRLEAAIGAGPPSLTVGLNATSDGLLLTPTSGTVSVTDLDGGVTASQLGIAATASATITGGDLQARITGQTNVADLNGGAGINLAGGLTITSGSTTAVIDLSGATTVEDVLNAISSQSKAAGIDVVVGLNDTQTGIAVAGRTSGANFSIGENGGTAATDLGLRTFTAQTSLAELNLGLGVPKYDYQLEITRRDGMNVSVDLSTASTVEDVLNAINAVDPGVLVASLNTTGNGITLLDNDGVSTGPLTVSTNPLSQALGLAGTEAGPDPTVPLVGSDSHPQEAQGVFNLLLRLETALRTGDDVELNRLAPKFNTELDRFDEVRADVGTRLQTLEEVDNRLKDRAVTLQESLSSVFDADIAEVLSQVAYTQATLEATLRISAQTMGLNLINYL